MDHTELEGRTVLDNQGNKVGTIDEVYIDPDTQRPQWGVIRNGILGRKGIFVPLVDATPEGGDLRLPFSRDKVTGAPEVDADGEISVDEEAALAAHYGLGYSTAESESGVLTGRGEPQATGEPAGTDATMTRSEERIRVGTMRRPSELVRLRKRVVTKPVSETVRLQREEARVEREPIDAEGLDPTSSGAEISEEVREVTLSREEPVVEKRTVEVERFHVDKDVVTEEQEVTGEVRKERIDVEREEQR